MQDLKQLRADLEAALQRESEAEDEDTALAMRALLAIIERLDDRSEKAEERRNIYRRKQ